MQHQKHRFLSSIVVLLSTRTSTRQRLRFFKSHSWKRAAIVMAAAVVVGLPRSTRADAVAPDTAYKYMDNLRGMLAQARALIEKDPQTARKTFIEAAEKAEKMPYELTKEADGKLFQPGVSPSDSNSFFKDYTPNLWAGYAYYQAGRLETDPAKRTLRFQQAGRYLPLKMKSQHPGYKLLFAQKMALVSALYGNGTDPAELIKCIGGIIEKGKLGGIQDEMKSFHKDLETLGTFFFIEPNAKEYHFRDEQEAKLLSELDADLQQQLQLTVSADVKPGDDENSLRLQLHVNSLKPVNVVITGDDDVSRTVENVRGERDLLWPRSENLTTLKLQITGVDPEESALRKQISEQMHLPELAGQATRQVAINGGSIVLEPRLRVASGEQVGEKTLLTLKDGVTVGAGTLHLLHLQPGDQVTLTVKEVGGAVHDIPVKLPDTPPRDFPLDAFSVTENAVLTSKWLFIVARRRLTSLLSLYRFALLLSPMPVTVCRI